MLLIRVPRRADGRSNNETDRQCKLVARLSEKEETVIIQARHSTTLWY